MKAIRLTRAVVVGHAQGLHMRPAMMFAQKAAEYQSAIMVSRDDRRADGKSLFELMFLAAEQGQELVLEAIGDDAALALDALAVVLANDAPNTAPPKG